MADDFRNSLQESNFSVGSHEIFDTVLVNTKEAALIYEAALIQGINLRLID
jgi:hypothetical protein